MLIIFASEVTSNQGPCERFELRNYKLLTNQHSCSLDKTTAINSSDFTISSASNNSVLGMYFRNNKKIFFLPVGVDKSFQNLVSIRADACSIESITKENFVKLSKLKYLNLQNNRIEKIMSDTFFDLKSLEYLNLSKKAFYPNRNDFIFIFFIQNKTS